MLTFDPMDEKAVFKLFATEFIPAVAAKAIKANTNAYSIRS